MKNNKVDKPWGFYEDYFRNENVVFKKIVVLPNERLSLQYHDNRDEFWYIVEGTGRLYINDEQSIVQAGHSVLITAPTKHAIECVSSPCSRSIVPLVIYEMQCGECCEEDIVRLEDKYGRIEE